MTFAPKTVDQPHEGFFKMREYSRGPWVPASIYRPLSLEPWTGEVMDRYPALIAEKNDVLIEVTEVWTWGTEITEKEYKWLKAQTALRNQRSAS